MTNIRRFSRKSKSKISYPVCKSAIRPVSHNLDLPVPKPPTEKDYTLSVNEHASTGTESEEDLVESNSSFQNESSPLFINQKSPNDLVQGLCLSKKKAEVFGSRLQQWNLLESGRTVSSFRTRNHNLTRYYASAVNKCYCKDIQGLVAELGYEYNLVH